MKIRTRIFLVFTLALAAGFISLVLWIRDDLRPRYLESLEEPLVDTAHILSGLLAGDLTDTRSRQELHKVFGSVYARRFKARIYALERDRVDMRVYVTDQHGIVVFDSDGGRDEGSDYSKWNDVLRALHGEYGARSTRDDPRDPVNAVVYVAAPIIVQDRIVGVVSVGKPKHNVDQFVRAAQQKMLIAAFAAACLALLLGIVLSAWVTRPLQKLTAYAQAVKDGRRAALPVLGRNEIGMMGTAMEEMRAALEGKEYVERYVQTLTHELKSPLAAIRGAAELLGEDLPAEERQRFLANIRNEAQRLQNLVDRMLLLASVEKRQGLEKTETILLAPLIGELAENLRPVTQSRNISIRNEVNADLRVSGERFLLRQAISNLLQNAVEFSPANGEIAVSAKPSQGRVELGIRDHGPGIPDYALPRLFERFYSLPRPDGQQKGTGLGLNFVREVAELHGGSVSLQNNPDSGVTAILRLPPG